MRYSWEGGDQEWCEIARRVGDQEGREIARRGGGGRYPEARDIVTMYSNLKMLTGKITKP